MEQNTKCSVNEYIIHLFSLSIKKQKRAPLKTINCISDWQLIIIHCDDSLWICQRIDGPVFTNKTRKGKQKIIWQNICLSWQGGVFVATDVRGTNN